MRMGNTPSYVFRFFKSADGKSSGSSADGRYCPSFSEFFLLRASQPGGKKWKKKERERRKTKKKKKKENKEEKRRRKKVDEIPPTASVLLPSRGTPWEAGSSPRVQEGASWGPECASVLGAWNVKKRFVSSSNVPCNYFGRYILSLVVSCNRLTFRVGC